MRKFSHFRWGYLTSNGSGEQDQQTKSACIYDLSSSIDKVSYKSNSMSLGLVLLEEKMFTWTHYGDVIMPVVMQYCQLDDKSADITSVLDSI